MYHAIIFAFLCSLAQAQPFAWGVNGHPLSQEGYWQVPLSRQLDLARDLGTQWYRIDISAASFQANTARMDELLDEAGQRGIKLLPVLLPDTPWMSEEASVAQLQSAAADFARAIVSRYQGRISHWELGNELDLFALLKKGEVTRGGKLWEWDGAPDGSNVEDFHQERYERASALIQGLQAGVKEADPAALTLVNTAGWLHYGFIERLVKEDRVPFDILAWHWYSEMGDMTKVRGSLDLVALLNSYGKPLWITEINRRDGSKGGKEGDAADYLAATAKQLGNHAGIEGFFVYELLDEPYFGTEGESDYGLVRLLRDANTGWKEGGKKPAFERLREVIHDRQ